MSNKTEGRCYTFEEVLEAIDKTNANDIAISEHQKEITKLENKKEVDYRNELIVAANYFTREKISELHDKSIKYLKCDDFDKTEYIYVFSDITRIKKEHIDFLVRRQEEIIEYEFKSNNLTTKKPNEKTTSFLVALASIFRGGTENDL